ncbi:MAG TPA: peroxidase [Bacteroidetes bacterium]|nr:peroxidase [Bacteroidota bacterium]
MAYISYIPEELAGKSLLELYQRFRAPHGDVDHILKIHSHNPPSMLGHYELYKALMFKKSELSRVQREMIAVVVSSTNKCFY